jgi:hypothetical protein
VRWDFLTSRTRPADSVVPQAEHDPVPTASTERVTGMVPPIRRPATVPGPSWDGIVSADAPWGAWLEVPESGTGAIQLTWGAGPQPLLQLADAEGRWCTPEEQPDPPMHTAWVQLPAGWTWIGVAAPYAESQPIRVVTWLPAQAREPAA